MSKNSKLQSQIDEFENRVSDSVARPLHLQLQKELQQYKKSCETTTSERDQARGEVTDLKRQLSKINDESSRLNREHKQATEEVSQLQSHNQFWKNKFKSLREELTRQRITHTTVQQLPKNSLTKSNSFSFVSYSGNRSVSLDADENENEKLISVSVKHEKKKKNNGKKYSKSVKNGMVNDNGSDQPVNSLSMYVLHDRQEIERLNEELDMMRKSRDNALLSVNDLQRHLHLEVKKNSHQKFKKNLYGVRASDVTKGYLKQIEFCFYFCVFLFDLFVVFLFFSDLTWLANELTDVVSDKHQNIQHLKKVLRLLGDRVTELEEENGVLKASVDGKIEISMLENSHSQVNEEVENIENNTT